MDIRPANQNVTDSRQTISNHMQAAVLIISPSPMLASGNKAPILLMHDLPALRVYQGDIEYKYISPCTCTCDARMCVHVMTCLSHRARAGLRPTCDECLVSAARQSTHCTDDGRE